MDDSRTGAGGDAAIAACSLPSGPLIERNARCFGCGYSLQGFRVGGVCPECGKAISEETLRQLVYEGRRVIRAMLRGSTLIGIGLAPVVGVFILACIAPLLALFYSPAAVYVYFGRSPLTLIGMALLGISREVSLIAAGVVILCCLFVGLGSWMHTPRLRGESAPERRLRQMVKAGAVVAAVSAFSMAAWTILLYINGRGSSAFVIGWLIAILLGAGALLAWCAWTARVAQRAADVRMRRQARRLFWTVAIVAAAHGGLYGVLQINAAGSSAWSGSNLALIALGIALSVVVWFGLLVAAIRLMGLVSRVRGALRSALARMPTDAAHAGGSAAPES